MVPIHYLVKVHIFIGNANILYISVRKVEHVCLGVVALEVSCKHYVFMEKPRFLRKNMKKYIFFAKKFAE